MPRFHYHDFRSLERTPASPSHLHQRITDLVYSSVNARAKVESVNPETGEYRIVLQGTLDTESTPHVSNWNSST
jgi:hypothetical protein